MTTLTVSEAARRTGRHPATVRRWIRSGRLRAQRVGTQHVIEEADVAAMAEAKFAMLPLPPAWQRTTWGSPMPNVVRLVRAARRVTPRVRGHSHVLGPVDL